MQTNAIHPGALEPFCKLTATQKKVVELITSGAKHILLYGGSRSGKTYILAIAILIRALRYPGSCHLICRYRAKHAKSSVLHQTLLPILNESIRQGYTYSKHESLITFPNGSEIWIGGLGDDRGLDKVLGHEYNTIYFNEISEISYAAVTTAYSRLAKATPGCQNLFFYDCNPTTPHHWAYKEFILKKSFLSGESLEEPALYAALLMNPADNQENLAKDYISGILSLLPEKQRARFRDGA